MKKMRTSLLALCLFLFAYRATSTDIVDTDGELVSNGGSAYYLVPVSGELRGGLRPATVGNDSFHKSVVLDTNLTRGIPVRFSSPLSIAIITPSMFLDIEFVSRLRIVQVWKVYPEFPTGWAVKISHELPFMGPFKVEPVKTGYKIVFYPEGGDTGADLGIVYAGGHYRLVVKDGDPFIFKIKKAFKSSA